MKKKYTIQEGLESLNRTKLFMRYDLSKTLTENTQPSIDIFYYEPKKTNQNKYELNYIREGNPTPTHVLSYWAKDLFPHVKNPLEFPRILEIERVRQLSSGKFTIDQVKDFHKMVDKTTKEADRVQYISEHYKCVPENFRDAVYFAIHNEKLDKNFVKHALGIIGRESDYGQTTKSLKGPGFLQIPLPSRYAIKSPFEYIYNSMEDDSHLKKMINWGVTKWKGKKGAKWVPSMGLSQMTPDIAKKYGVNIDDLMNAIGSLVATTRYLLDNYKILSTYYDDNVPSVILKDGKLIQNPYSTGNARLDAAIASYNTGPKKYSTFFCTTNSNEYLGPCDEETYLPFGKSKPDFVLKVNQQNQVKNYFPRYIDGKLTNIGYLKEVKTRVVGFNCI